MCLERVIAQDRESFQAGRDWNKKVEVLAWKAFHYNCSTELRAEALWQPRHNTVIGEWNRDTNEQILFADHVEERVAHVDYQSGFHAFLSKESAEKHSRSTTVRSIVSPVLVREIMSFGVEISIGVDDAHLCIVAKELFIHPHLWEKALHEAGWFAMKQSYDSPQIIDAPQVIDALQITEKDLTWIEKRPLKV